MQCPNCRLEKLPYTDICDCGYSFDSGAREFDSAGKKCPLCVKYVRADAVICPSCEEPLREAKRPMVGMAIATMLGIGGLIRSASVLSSAMITLPAGVQATLHHSSAEYQVAALIGASVTLVGYCALLLGVFMTFSHLPHGRSVVRITSWIMMAVIILQTVLLTNLVARSSTFESLAGPASGGLLGGLVGSAIVGVLVQWGMILFLFRNRPGVAPLDPLLTSERT